MSDERRRDHDRDIGRRSAEAADDDRHERHKNGDVNATADRAECVDPEVTSDARGRPVAIHARDRTLARQEALPEGPRGGYLGSISRRKVRPRTVSAGSRPEAAARPVLTGSAGRAGSAKPTTGGLRTERRGAARTGCGGADDDASIRIDADGFRFHAGQVLHGEVHDPPFVREHRLERHRLPARFDARCHAARDLAKLLLAATPITLDVERDVDRAADPPRGDRGGDLLRRDEVPPAAADERSEVRAENVDALVTWALVEHDLRLDAHQGEQIAQNTDPRFEILGERRRRFLAFGLLALLAAFLALTDRIGAAR